MAKRALASGVKISKPRMPGGVSGSVRPVEVKSIRQHLSLSQAEFAKAYGFNPRTVQEWEQGRAKPDLATRAYLTVIDRNPEAVREALRQA